jgi:hypothetical protein
MKPFPMPWQSLRMPARPFPVYSAVVLSGKTACRYLFSEMLRLSKIGSVSTEFATFQTVNAQLTAARPWFDKLSATSCGKG